MIFGAVILFFLIGVVAIYALIQTGKNYALQAVLIPIILVGTLFAGYAIYILQGTPKNGIPDYEVEVVFIEMQKPWIIFLAREASNDDEESSTDPIPKYFKIPYNDENRKTMNKIMKKMEMGQQVEGKFKKKKVNPNGTQPPTGEFQFDNIRRDGLPPKAVREDDNPISDFEGLDPGIQNRLIERGDYDVLGSSINPGTTPIDHGSTSTFFDHKEFSERTGEQVTKRSVYLKKYTTEQLEAFTDSWIDEKYDYYEAPF